MSGSPIPAVPDDDVRSATITTVTALPQPARTRAWLHLLVTVTGAAGQPAAGTVTIRDGSLVLGAASLTDGRGTLKVRLFSGGQHDVQARYEGDDHAAPSHGCCTVVVLEQAWVVVSASRDPLGGEAVTLLARVHGRWDSRPCSGTVLFECDGEPLGSAAIRTGTASFACCFPPGLHTITAVYPGDDRYGGARSEPLTIEDLPTPSDGRE